jgi:hypothetical protein
MAVKGTGAMLYTYWLGMREKNHVYKPPHQSLSTVTQDLQNMLHFIPHDSTSRTILLGDLNSDILQLSRELKTFQQQIANSLGIHAWFNCHRICSLNTSCTDEVFSYSNCSSIPNSFHSSKNTNFVA